jgi:HNH endonuclease
MEETEKVRNRRNQAHGASRGPAGRFAATQAPAQRFWATVDATDTAGCWLWTGHLDDDGYGRFTITTAPGQRRTVRAHRWAYEHAVGPIPAGYTIDHVRARGCRHRHCVRPDHLEAVTHQENLQRRRRRR